MSLTWTIGGVTLTPPAEEWGYQVDDLGTSIPVISGFTPAVVGRSAGRLGERGTIRHMERSTGRTAADVEAIVTSIRAKIDALLPTTPGLGYHDAVFPDWSGRVRIISLRPSYSRNSHIAYGYLTIEYQVVKG